MVDVVYIANTDWYIFNFRKNLIKQARETGLSVCIVTPTGKYGRQLQADGFDWRATPVFGTRRSLASRLCLFFGCVRAIAFGRPKIVHAFTVECVLYASLMGLLSRSRSVYSLVGLGFLRDTSGSAPARVLRAALILTLKILWALQGRYLITVQNEEDQETLIEGRIAPRERIRLIQGGSGVNLARFRPRDDRCERERPRVLFAARLLWQKGIGDYVEAAHLLAEQGFQCDFWIAGAPDYGNPGTVDDAEIELWKRGGVVTYLGHRDDMERLLREVDLVLLPTYYGEGLPRILIEAAACGLPIIATDHVACRPVVRNGENGLLVRARDPRGLAVAIRKILSDPAARTRMGKRSREIAEAGFDERAVASAILDRYVEPD